MAPKILKYIDEHQWSWTAWCFHPGATPKLLDDWTYRPTTHWGAYVKCVLNGCADGRSMLDSVFPFDAHVMARTVDRNRDPLPIFANQGAQR